MKHEGKGVKGNLKRLHVINENDSIDKIVKGKETIEKELMEFNKSILKYSPIKNLKCQNM